MRWGMFPFGLIGLSWIAILGCSNPMDAGGPEVDVTTDRSSYHVGEEIELRITNRDQVAINVHHSSPGFCAAAMLQRWDGAKWVFQQTGQVCAMDSRLHELPPGQTLTVRIRVSEPGERYRFVTGTSVGLNRDRMGLQPSNVFAVEG